MQIEDKYMLLLSSGRPGKCYQAQKFLVVHKPAGWPANSKIPIAKFQNPPIPKSHFCIQSNIDNVCMYVSFEYFSYTSDVPSDLNAHNLHCADAATQAHGPKKEAKVCLVAHQRRRRYDLYILCVVDV